MVGQSRGYLANLNPDWSCSGRPSRQGGAPAASARPPAGQPPGVRVEDPARK